MLVNLPLWSKLLTRWLINGWKRQKTQMTRNSRGNLVPEKRELTLRISFRWQWISLRSNKKLKISIRAKILWIINSCLDRSVNKKSLSTERRCVRLIKYFLKSWKNSEELDKSTKRLLESSIRSKKIGFFTLTTETNHPLQRRLMKMNSQRTKISFGPSNLTKPTMRTMYLCEKSSFKVTKPWTLRTRNLRWTSSYLFIRLKLVRIKRLNIKEMDLILPLCQSPLLPKSLFRSNSFRMNL